MVWNTNENLRYESTFANTLTDTDVHIPLYIRGPGIAEGAEIDAVTSHTDLASTILKIAGVEKQLDGAPIPLNKNSVEEYRKAEHAAIEYWGYVCLHRSHPHVRV